MIDLGLYTVYVLLIGAVVLAIGMSIANGAQNPKSFITALYSIGALLVLAIICYVATNPHVTPQQASKGFTDGEVKFISAGLIMFYIVLAVAVIGLIYSEINKALK